MSIDFSLNILNCIFFSLSIFLTKLQLQKIFKRVVRQEKVLLVILHNFLCFPQKIVEKYLAETINLYSVFFINLYNLFCNIFKCVNVTEKIAISKNLRKFENYYFDLILSIKIFVYSILSLKIGVLKVV